MREIGLTAERLRQQLSYDQESGIFTWRCYRSNLPPDGRAGWLDHGGYVFISVDGRRYLAHRLAWLYVYGQWPDEKIDHIDGCGNNNRIANLRPANCSQNQANRRLNKNNKSGFKGVSWDKQFSRWRATIRSSGKSKHLGLFHSPEEAHAVYMAEARRLHGEYARAA
jgi:hypothetical protein